MSMWRIRRTVCKVLIVYAETVIEEFDLYCAASADAFVPGAVVTLDGIDGFFDQHFDGIKPGTTIRFVIVRGPSGIPLSTEAAEGLPFVTAVVLQSSEIDGDVEVVSVATFGGWMRSLSPSPVTIEEIEAQVQDAPVAGLVKEAALHEKAFWRSGARYWRNLSETSLVWAVRVGPRVRLAVLRTNGGAGFIADVRTGS
jgi:hypothetical protein